MEVEQAKQNTLIPIKIAFLFIAISFGWFIFSDYIAIHFFKDLQQASYYLHIFQFTYLVLSAVALYFFVKSQLVKQHSAQQSIQTLLTEAPTAIAVISDSGQFLETNKAYQYLLGYSAEQLSQCNYFDLINPSFVATERNQQTKLNKTDLECHYSTQYIHQQGNVISVEQNLRLIELNHQPAIVIFIDEIATIKNTSIQLMQSQQKFFKAFYFQPISMLIFNIKTGERVEFNEGFCKLTGYNREQLEQGNLYTHDIFPDEQKLRAGITKLVEQGEVHNFDAVIKTKDGSIRQCLLNASMLGDDNDELAIVSHIDITEQKQLFENLTQAAITTSLQPSEQFFNELVLHLAQAFDAQHALVGKLTDDGKSIHCLAMCSNGQLTDNITYQLTGTPCAQVMNKQICVIEQNCAALYPNDDLLQQMNIQGYIGVPILQQEQTPIGILVLLFEKPFEQKPYYQALLKIFSAKVSQELRHIEITKQMRRTEQHLTLYREQAPLASIEWDLNFNVVNWNQAAEQMFGYSFDEITHVDFVETLVPEEDKPQVINVCKALVAEQGGKLSVNHIITKSGNKILCEWHNSLIKDQYGQALGSTSIVRDISEEMRTMHMLIQKENEQRELLDSMIDAVLTIDEQGIVLSFNRAAEQVFGYHASDIVGHKISELFNVKDDQIDNLFLFEQLMQQTMQGGTQQAMEFSAKHKHGRCFAIRLAIAELATKAQGKRRFVLNCQDISLLKRQQEQIQRIQKMDALGKLTGGIAHDFNNILGVISGYSELLTAQLTEQAPLKKYAEQVYKASQRGADLTRKLLSFSRQQPSQHQLININNQLQQLHEMLAKTLTANIDIQLQLADELGEVQLDPSEFSDLILNLSINAKHAMPEGGQLTFITNKVCLSSVEASRLDIAPGYYLKLDVQDTGSGMTPEVKRRIFEPFYTTKGNEGTGLGLAQVYGCVKAAQGGINVYSELGQGTCFSLYFPIKNKKLPEKLSEKQKNSTTQKTANGEIILVVDDEADLCEVAAAMLKQLGYQVITATSAMQALSILEKSPVDLVLSDIIMPKTSGYQLAEQIQQQYPSIAILFASGFQGERKLPETLSIDVVSKPYNKQTLGQAVQATLAKKKTANNANSNQNITDKTKEKAQINLDKASSINCSIAPQLDNEHLVIAQKLAQIPLLVSEQNESSLVELLNEITLLIQHHFETEQVFMKQVTYPHVENHQQVHQMLLQQIEQQKQRPVLAQAQWFTAHFAELYQEHVNLMDASLANFVAHNKQHISQD